MSKLSMRGSKWKRLRKKLLVEAGYRCSKCNRPGKLEVDHIIPLEKGGDGYDRQNLQVLCKSCHFVKSGYPVPKHTKDKAAWGTFVNELV